MVEVLGLKDEIDHKIILLCERFAEALTIYHQQNWPIARDMFKAILDETPEDGPSKFYLERSLLNLKTSAHYDDPTLVHMDEK